MEFFVAVGNRGYFHPVANVAPNQGRELALEAIRKACELGLTELLINFLDLTGTEPPTVFSRHEFIRRWVEIAGNRLRVAFVMRLEYLDLQNIGAVMASNRGASGQSFSTEAQALAWLDGRRPAPGTSGG